MIPVELRPPLAALGLIVLGGAAALGAALHLHGKAATARQQAQRDWAEAHTTLARLPERMAVVRAPGAWHAELQGPAPDSSVRRLTWISALAQTQRTFALESVTWRLEPDRPSALPGLTATRMHVELTPMDAARLRDWLARLDRLGQGPYTVEQCDWTLGDTLPRMRCVLIGWSFRPEEGTQ